MKQIPEEVWLCALLPGYKRRKPCLHAGKGVEKSQATLCLCQPGYFISNQSSGNVSANNILLCDFDPSPTALESHFTI